VTFALADASSTSRTFSARAAGVKGFWRNGSPVSRDAMISHGVCPECLKKYYPEVRL
jgi:hypothetical protein